MCLCAFRVRLEALRRWWQYRRFHAGRDPCSARSRPSTSRERPLQAPDCRGVGVALVAFSQMFSKMKKIGEKSVRTLKLQSSPKKRIVFPYGPHCSSLFRRRTTDPISIPRPTVLHEAVSIFYHLSYTEEQRCGTSVQVVEEWEWNRHWGRCGVELAVRGRSWGHISDIDCIVAQGTESCRLRSRVNVVCAV